jgi:hypothetical protein
MIDTVRGIGIVSPACSGAIPANPVWRSSSGLAQAHETGCGCRRRAPHGHERQRRVVKAVFDCFVAALLAMTALPLTSDTASRVSVPVVRHPAENRLERM